MDTNKLVYVALELGSSHICGLLAYKDALGRVVPMASRRVESKGSIVHGTIYNIDAASAIAKEIIRDFNQELESSGYSISQVYVSIDCRSLHSLRHIVSHSYDGDGILATEEHVKALEEELLKEQFDGYEILSVLPPYYHVNGRRENSIVGMLCREVRVYYTLLLVRKTYVRLITDLVEKRLRLKLAGILAAPICEAQVILSPGIRQMGCALVNIGADCTTVSVYKEDALELLRVYPVGGSAVTRDLSTLHILREDAEEIKCSRLSAVSEMKDGDSFVEIPSFIGKEAQQIRLLDLNRCAQARMKEIIANVQALVESSGVANRIDGGYIFTGGGCLIGRFNRLLKDMGINDSIQVTSVNDKLFFAEPNTDEFFASPSQYASIVGAIYCATKGCLEVANTVFSPLTEEDEFENEPSKPLRQDEPLHSPSEGRTTRREEYTRDVEEDLYSQSNPMPRKEEKKNKFSLGRVFKDILDVASNTRPEGEEEDEEDEEE
ncbi:cell division FtsA domain-containing protein [uncultured Porphyromonas sp.]|uniref:cell division protein FtsA n=1 Tax=uncultured Porphyromonas sp. TaxID=159274 RepID=UPI002602AEB2|nr:cell division FtsA domain-containing protein [uncultured Porphyromonas sp.]